jgi:hypothetical protein
MNTISRVLTVLICGSLWGAAMSANGANAANEQVAAAVQAIEQAPDPSTAVAAYANGMAVSRGSPAVQEAYVARMVDFGLPEMAYSQARALTVAVPNNGLAWGVVAYVDARRGDMTNAIAALSLAARFAPAHPFVQRTAGELIAWYDSQAAQIQLPASAKAGLEKVRKLLRDHPAYIAAYDAAKKAYQSATAQASSLGETGVPEAGLAPPPVPPPSYYPYYLEPYSSSYYDEYGYPWETYPWWWSPEGSFSGPYFVPYPYVIFGRRGEFHHGRAHGEHGEQGEYGEHGGHGEHGHGENGHRGLAGHSWDHLSSGGVRLQEGQGRASHPSWSALGMAPGSEVGHGFRSIRPVPEPNRIAPSRRSWSVLGNRGETAPGHTPPPAASLHSPSWSGFGLDSGVRTPRAAPSVAAPHISRPSAAPPFWSNFGHGAAVPSSPAVSVRSGGVASAAPSWSVLGGGGHRR